MSPFILHALPAGEVDTDAPVTRHKTADDREPCRRCLRDARPGERLALTAYDPFTRPQPVRRRGPGVRPRRRLRAVRLRARRRLRAGRRPHAVDPRLRRRRDADRGERARGRAASASARRSCSTTPRSSSCTCTSPGPAASRSASTAPRPRVRSSSVTTPCSSAAEASRARFCCGGTSSSPNAWKSACMCDLTVSALRNSSSAMSALDGSAAKPASANGRHSATSTRRCAIETMICGARAGAVSALARVADGAERRATCRPPA